MHIKRVDRIEQAFLHLHFSIKLHAYTADRNINKVVFDARRNVYDEWGEHVLEGSAFNTYEDIVIGAQNSYLLSFAAAVNALHVALDEAGIPNDPNDRSERGQLRTLIYMLRCAFMHDLITPKWQAKGPYQHTIRIALDELRIVLPMQELHGHTFRTEHIRGATGLFALRDAVLRLLRSESEV